MCTHTALRIVPGEKLDYKTCEALEEVFKRLQFKVVDLEQTNLDEDVSSLPLPIPTPRAPCLLEVWGEGMAGGGNPLGPRLGGAS